jgi:hypothetical protein
MLTKGKANMGKIWGKGSNMAIEIKQWMNLTKWDIEKIEEVGQQMKLKLDNSYVVHNEWTKGNVTLGQLMDGLCINLGKLDDLRN